MKNSDNNNKYTIYETIFFNNILSKITMNIIYNSNFTLFHLLYNQHKLNILIKILLIDSLNILLY